MRLAAWSGNRARPSGLAAEGHAARALPRLRHIAGTNPPSSEPVREENCRNREFNRQSREDNERVIDARFVLLRDNAKLISRIFLRAESPRWSFRLEAGGATGAFWHHHFETWEVRGGERIHLLGSVECDHDDAAVPIDKQFAHCAAPLGGSNTSSLCSPRDGGRR